MSTRTIKRYSSPILTSQTAGSNVKLLTIDDDVSYAQLVDIRVLIDTSDYGNLQNLRFGLWAVDANGTKIASFYPKNYIIETSDTEFYTAFEHYIQLPPGSSVYFCTNLDDQVGGNNFSVCVNATVETYK